MDRIVFSSGASFNLVNNGKNPVQPYNKDRQGIVISVVGAYADVKAAFVDSAEYGKQWDSSLTQPVLDEAGNYTYDEGGNMITTTSTVTEEQSLSDYCLAISITDNLDGTFDVYMGKKTELEILEAENAVLLFTALTGEAY